MVEIIEYSEDHQCAFKAINVEWLERYNLMESHDMAILDDPKKYILDTGGVIYLARLNGDIVGSAALIKEHDGVFELVKMAVVPQLRNQGISKLLLEKCILKARSLKAKKIILFSNHQLQAALSLYEKYGFTHIPVVGSPFATADIKMELKLND
jgi:putative acetyltransferase